MKHVNIDPATVPPTFILDGLLTQLLRNFWQLLSSHSSSRPQVTLHQTLCQARQIYSNLASSSSSCSSSLL
jgi:hypothetical protein